MDRQGGWGRWLALAQHQAAFRLEAGLPAELVVEKFGNGELGQLPFHGLIQPLL